jgi:hypothetical protein
MHGRRRFLILFGFLTVWSWLLPSPAAAVEVQSLLESPGRYDNQQVTVTGKASAPRLNESRGKPFTVFDLTDGAGHSVRVFSWGHPAVHEGDLVEVEGTFLAAKQVGRHTIKNEIEARSVRLLSGSH